jgi:hypothetical protein
MVSERMIITYDEEQMSCLKVILEGHCFSGEINGQKVIIGFYSTVGIVATTNQEFAQELEEALHVVIKKNGLGVLGRVHQKSFCRILEIYSVENRSSFAELGGMTLFRENMLQLAFSSLVGMFLAMSKSRKLVKVRQY